MKLLEIPAIKKGDAYHIAYEHDKIVHRENLKQEQWVKLTVKAVTPPRSWHQLAFYKASCRTLSENTDDPNLSTPVKVDLFLKIMHGFIKDTVIFNNNAQFIPRSLSYKNCNHPEATFFINKAIDTICGYLGCTESELKKGMYDEKPKRIRAQNSPSV